MKGHIFSKYYIAVDVSLLILDKLSVVPLYLIIFRYNCGVLSARGSGPGPGPGPGSVSDPERKVGRLLTAQVPDNGCPLG